MPHNKSMLAGATSSVAAGCLLILFGYRNASAGRTTEAFSVFWVGMALLWGTLAALSVTNALPSRGRHLLLTVMGLAAYLPAFIRDPSSPMFYDEDGHYAEADSILRTGRLFLPNGLVPMASKYPGLHTLTVALVRVSGLPLFRVATILIALFHIASVTGIYTITKTLQHDQRHATVAALLYAISPTVSFFDSMYAYESFAVPLAIWAIALLFFAGTLPWTRARFYYALSLLLGLCLDITHHFTAYATIVLGLFYGLCLLLYSARGTNLHSRNTSLLSLRSHCIAAFTVSGLMGIGAGLWVVVRSIPIVGYLGVFPEQGFLEIGHILFGTAPLRAPGGALAAAGGTRQLFAGSGLPFYEQYAAFIVPPLMCLAIIVTIVRNRKQMNPRSVCLTALCFVYFATLPLVITTEGSAAVHRSWAFSWIAVSCMASPGLIWARDSVFRLPSLSGSGLRVQRGLAASLFILSVVLVQVGNYGGNVNSVDMFPGPFIMEADGRTTPEQIEMAKWFAAHEGYGRFVVTDKRNFEVLVAYSDALPSSFQPWVLFFPTEPPSASVVSMLYKDHVQFVLVDQRLTLDRTPSLWFSNSQPKAPANPLPRQAIDKFARLPYLRKIHKVGSLTMYEVVPGYGKDSR